MEQPDLEAICRFLAKRPLRAPTLWEQVKIGYLMHVGGLALARQYTAELPLRHYGDGFYADQMINLQQNYRQLLFPQRRRVVLPEAPREPSVPQSDVGSFRSVSEDAVRAATPPGRCDAAVGSQVARPKRRRQGTGCMTQQFKRENLSPPPDRHRRGRKEK